MRKLGSKEIVAISLLGALAALLEVIRGPPFDIRFPLYPNISWDFTGIPIMISLMLYGPLSAVYTCLIGCSIIFFRGNVPGGTLKLIAELATLLGFALLRKGVVSKSIAAIISRVGVMTIANYYLLQLFYEMKTPIVVGLLAPIALFNISQALINIVPAYHISVIIYSSVPNLLHNRKT
ncbi:MAG: hypothetical protein JSV85_03325 [Candidatus Bathyarchaeota archaeon]|nr:MAG: hypothetical protein JSV85_03325 [Candidatus Bathyarchaeota archaeon]